MTNTMKILKTLAVLVVLASGCDGSTAGAPAGTGGTAGAPAGTGGTAGVGGVGGGGTAGDAGTGGTLGGTTGVAGVGGGGDAGAAGAAGAGADGATGAGGSVSCGLGESCGMPAPVCQGSTCIAGANPCASFAGPGGATRGIGWDVVANECWPTRWCEPSVTILPSLTSAYHQRPVSAVCPVGVSTYTYAPGTLMIWGSGVGGSEYHQPATGNPWVDGQAQVSYRCVVNSQPVTVDC